MKTLDASRAFQSGGRRISSTAAHATAEALERRLVLSVFLHHGAADPSTEGWQPLLVAGGGVKVGAVHDGSVDAWRIEDLPTPQGGSISYSQTPTAAQMSQAAKEGWVLSARVRVPAVGQSTNELAAIYDDGTTRFQMQFGSNAAGDPLVTLPLPSAPITMSVPGAGETYNTFEIVHSPIAGSNGLFINGKGQLSFPGTKGTTRLIDWGDLSGGPGGTGDFNNVQFTAFSVYFTGAGDGKSWTDPKNWSTGAVPGPKDDVLIELPVGTSNPTIVINQGTQSVNSLVSVNNLSVTGGTLSVAQPSELLGKLNLNGGAIGGAGDLTAFGGFSWGDGSLTGSGHFLLPAVATADLSGTLVLSREFENAGTVNLTNADLLGGSPQAELNNLPGGQFTATGQNTIGGSAAGDITVLNAGSFTLSGQGATAVNGTFTSTGNLTVNGGSLSLNGANTIGGKVFLASGAQFLPSNGTTFRAATLGGAYTFVNEGLQVLGGLTLSSQSSITLSSAKLSFSGEGGLGGTGIINLRDASSLIALLLPAPAISYTLTVGAGITIEGQGGITGGPGTGIVNDGKLIALLNRLDVNVDSFTNAGSAGGQQGGVLSFTGRVFTAQSGTADVNGDLNAEFLEISGGTLNFDGQKPASVTTLSLNRGTLAGAGDINVSTEFDWPCCGEIGGDGTLTLEPGGVGKLGGTLSLTRRFNNGGTTTFTGTVAGTSQQPGRIDNLAGASFTTTGTVVVGSSQARTAFNNAGKFIQNGQGNATLNGPITNSGTVTVQTGVLVLNSPSGNVVGGTVSLASRTGLFPNGTLFDAVTLDGAFAFSNDNLRFTGGLTLTVRSSITLSGTELDFLGDQTLAGQGGIGLDPFSVVSIQNVAGQQPSTLTIDPASGLGGDGKILGQPGTRLLNEGTLGAFRGELDVEVPTLTDTGPIEEQNGTVAFTGDLLTVRDTTASISGGLTADEVDVAGGLTLNGAPVSVPVLSLSAGTLDGSADVTVTSRFGASGGVWRGTGLATIGQGAMFTADGSVDIARPLNANGIIAVRSGTLTLEGGGTAAGQVDLAGGSTLAVGGSEPFSFLGTSALTGDGSVRKSGPGALQLTASNQFTGGTTIADGTVVAGDAHALGSGPLTLDTSNGSPTLDTGAGLLLPAVQVTGGHTAALAHRSSGGTLTANSVIIDADSQFDVTNNLLQIPYGNNPDPLAQIQKYIATGYAGGTWKGPGLVTSTGLALGYADSSNQVLVKPTVSGDADLDGRVTFNDLLTLAQHFGQGGGVWMGGDFNYDGSVTFPDLLLLAQHYVSTALTAGNPSSTAGADAGWRVRHRSRI